MAKKTTRDRVIAALNKYSNGNGGLTRSVDTSEETYNRYKQELENEASASSVSQNLQIPGSSAYSNAYRRNVAQSIGKQIRADAAAQPTNPIQRYQNYIRNSELPKAENVEAYFKDMMPKWEEKKQNGKPDEILAAENRLNALSEDTQNDINNIIKRRNNNPGQISKKIKEREGWDEDTLNSYISDAYDVFNSKNNSGLNDKETIMYSLGKMDELSPEEKDVLSRQRKDLESYSMKAKETINYGDYYGDYVVPTDKWRDELKAIDPNKWTDEKLDEYDSYNRRIANANTEEKFNERFDINSYKGNPTVQAIGNTLYQLNPIRNAEQGILGALDRKQYDGLGKDLNAPGASMQNSGDYAREQVLENAIGNSNKAGQFAYGAGLSIAQSAELMALGGIAGKVAGYATGAEAVGKAVADLATLTPFATQAFNSGYKEAKERGATNRQAAGYAVATGLAEAGTEKLSLDHLWGMFQGKGSKFVKNVLVDWAAQAGIEGSEEAFSDIANRISDYLVMGKDGKNAMSISIENHAAQIRQNNPNLSEEEVLDQAKSEAHWEFWGQVAQDFAAGALSGAVMGGAGVAVNNTRVNNQLNTIKEENAKRAEEITGDTEYDKKMKAQAEQYAKNPVRFIADSIDESTEVGKQQKKDAIELAKKYEQNKGKLGINDTFALSKSLEIAEDARDPEKSLDAAEKYLKYAQEAMATPVEYRTASTNMTLEEATESMQDAAKNGDVASMSDVYHTMKASPSEEVRNAADETYERFYGMAENAGATQEDLNSAKTSRQEAYISGMRGEEVGNITPQAQEAYNAGAQERIKKQTLNTVGNTAELSEVRTSDGRAVSVKGFNGDQIETTDGKMISVKDLDENSFVSTVYRTAATLPENMRDTFMSNLREGDSISDLAYTVKSVIREAIGGYEYEDYIKTLDGQKALGEFGDDRLSEMYIIGMDMAKDDVSNNKVSGIFHMGNKVTKGTGSFDARSREIARKYGATSGDIDAVYVLAKAFGLNFKVVEGSLEKENAHIQISSSTITVNANAFRQVAHELVGEFMQEYNREDHDALRKDLMGATLALFGQEKFNSRYDSYVNAYKEIHMSDIDIQREMTNDIFVEVLSTDKGMQAFADYVAEKYGVEAAKTTKEKLIDFVDHFKEAFKNIMSTGNSSNLQKDWASRADELDKYTERVIKAFDKAIQNYQAMETGESTSNDDTKNSLIIEEKDLIATHNMHADELEKVLDLGGFPMPSIAVMKADRTDANAGYGEVTVIFDKDTIDPKKDPKNKVYSGDAWTPNFPIIDIELKIEKAEELYRKMNDLTKRGGVMMINPVNFAPSNLVDSINRHINNNSGEASLIEQYKNDYEMKQAYLAETNSQLKEMPTTETKEKMTDEEVELSKMFIDYIPDAVDLVGTKAPKAILDQYRNSIDNVRREFYKKSFGFSDKEIDNVFANERAIDGFKELRKAKQYKDNGSTKVTINENRSKAKEIIDSRLNQAEYEKWLKNLFKGLEGKQGIYNGKDPYTASGNRKSWDALHFEVTLENVVKAMKQDVEKGGGAFGMGNPIAAATYEFSSIEDIKSKKNLLAMEEEEKYQKIRSEYTERFSDIATRAVLPGNDSFDAVMNAGEILIENIAKSKNKSQLNSKLKNESKFINYSKELVDDLWELVEDIRNMPTGYFEAKPQRAVGLDEIAKVVIPSDAPDQLVHKLSDRRIDYEIYEKGNEEQRSAIVASSDKKFSIQVDDMGRKLSEDQIEYFADTKIRDKDGNLLTVYHGTPSGGFTVFRNDITFYTANYDYAKRYTNPSASSRMSGKQSGNAQVYEGYLNIAKPFDIRDSKVMKIFINEYVKGGYSIGIDPYQTDAQIKKQIANGIDWTEADNIKEFIDDMGYDYDGIILNEGGDITANGTVMRGLSYAAFNSNQFKNADNMHPSENGDIRYSQYIDEEDLLAEYDLEKEVDAAWIASVEDIMNFLRESIEAATPKERKQAIRHLTRAALGDEFKAEGKTLAFKDERIDMYLRRFAASNPEYAKAYLTYMSPADFLLLTANGSKGTKTFDRIKAESRPLDFHELEINYQPIFLMLEEKGVAKATKNQIVGHEGRHRMYALQMAGYTQIPVIVFNEDNKYTKKPIDSIKVYPQAFTADANYNKSNLIEMTNLQPLSNGNRDTIIEQFGSGKDADVHYSMSIIEAEEKLGKQLDDWLHGEMPQNGYFDFGDTPTVLRKLGAPNLPIIMEENYILKLSTDYNDHAVSIDDLKKVPSEIADPIMILSGSIQNSFVVITEIEDKKDHPVIVAIHLNKLHNRLKINKIASVYGKDDIQKYLSNKENLLKYADKKRSLSWITIRGLQLPKMVQSINNASEITIPSNERKSNYKYSLIVDSEYLDAVRNGDLETAQRMVDEAAKRAGYNVKAYHGTTSGKFTIFRTNVINSNMGSHFGSEEIAKEFASGEYGGGDGSSNTLYAVYLKAQNPYVTYDWFAQDDFYPAYEAMKLADQIGTKEALKIRDEIMSLDPAFAEIYEDIDYLEEGYLDEKKAEILYGDFRKLLELGGYDSIQYANGLEYIGDTNYIIQHPEQIKLADPVTYDDDGNVVPLSERFDPSNPDIRYSMEIDDMMEFMDEFVFGDDYNSFSSILDDGLKALKGKQVDSKLIRSVATKLHSEYGSTMKIDTLANMLERTFAYLQTQDHVNYNDVMRVVEEIAKPFIEAIPHREGQAAYDAFVSGLKGYKIKLSSAQMTEVKNAYGSYKAYQQAMFPLRISNNAEMDMDELWSSLVEASGYILDPDVSEGNQPMAILDALDSLRPTVENNFNATDEEMARDLAMRIVEEYFGAQESEALKDAAARAKAVSAEYRDKIKADYQKRLAEAKKQIREDTAHAIENAKYGARWAEAEAKEKAENKIAKIRDEADKKVKEAKANARLSEAEKNKQIDQIKAEADQKVREARYNIKWNEAENNLKLAEMRAKNKKKLQNSKEVAEQRRQKGMIAKQAKKLMKWVMEPTDQYHVPKEFAEPLMEFLYALDFVEPELTYKNGKYSVRVYSHTVTDEYGHRRMVFDTLEGNTREEVLQKFYDAIGSGMGSRNQKQWTERMRSLQDMLNKVSNDDHTDWAMDNLMMMLDPELADEFNDLLMNNRGVANINTLSSADLKTINKVIRGITHAINMGNKAITQNATIDEWANDTIENAKEVKLKSHSKTFNKLSKTLSIDMATPETFFALQGKKGSQIFNSFMVALERKITDIKKASEYMSDALKDIDKKKLKKWTGNHAEVYSFNVHDGRIDLTIAQIMSLYELNKREQAVYHFVGGVKADTIMIKGREQIQNRAVHLTQQDLIDIFSVLTDEQKELADKMQQFLATECAKWGNEAAMLMYGYEKYTDPRYFPISPSKDTIAANNENTNREAMNGLEKSGFTKAVVKNANNPILIRDIFDVFTDHVTDMAAYHGYAPAVKDANRWFNFKTAEDIGNGFKEYTTVQQAINNNMFRADKSGTDYFVNLIHNINGYEKSGDIETIIDALVSTYKTAAIAGNLRVVIQQPTAFVRAANILDWKYMVSSLPKTFTASKNMERIKEISPLAWWKSQGYYEASLGKSIKEIVTGSATVRDKITEKSMWLAGKADDITWSILYSATEKQVKAETKGQNISEEEFRKMVNDKFNDVIAQTQVVDATIMKSQWMRSNAKYTKLKTAFMSEPTKSYNMAMKAMLSDYREEGGNPLKWKATRKALVVLALTDLLNSFAQAIIDGVRYKDDDDSYWETVMDYFEKNMLQAINPLNRVPGLKDITDPLFAALKGESSYGSSFGRTLEASAIESLLDTLSTSVKIVNGSYNKTPFAAYMTYAKALSYATGVPLYNISRDGAAFWNLFASGEHQLVKNVETANAKYNSFFDALDKEKSDEKLYEALDKAMGKNGTIKDVKSQIASKYKADYLLSLTTADKESQDALYTLMKRAYQAINLTEDDLNADIAEWMDTSVSYTDLDKAIESGEGIADIVAKLKEDGKEDDNIVDHILNTFGSTVDFNTGRENGSEIESRVNEALKAVNKDYSYGNVETESMIKEDLFKSIDNGDDYKIYVDKMVTDAESLKSTKSALTSKYKPMYKELYSKDKNAARQLRVRIAYVKAYADQKGKFEGNGKKSYFDYEYENMEKWSE